MNFIFRSILAIFIFFYLTINVNSTVVVTKELEEYFESDYVVKNEFDLTIVSELELGEYGKNVIFNDACKVDDGFIVVGGSVRMGDYLGGLDGLVVKYKDDVIEWFKVFGGAKKDIFNTVSCGEDIVVGGESYDDNFKSGLFVSLNGSGSVNWETHYREKLDLNIKSVDYFGNYIFAGYINNFSTDNDFFIIEISPSGEILRNKTFLYNGDDRINDILIDDFIYLVGSTDSVDLGVLGQRGIILKLDEEFNILESDIYQSSEISLLTSIDLYDEFYISGRVGKNEAVEVSDSYGVFGTYKDSLNLSEIDLDVNGVLKQEDNIFFGGIDNEPTIYFKELIKLKGTGEVIKAIDYDGIKTIHTNCDDVCTGIITSLNKVSKKNGDLYINDLLVEVEERYLREFKSDVFGEYKKYYYANSNGFEYYGDLSVESIEFYSNIDRSTYYDSVNLFFNGTGYLNGELIESGYMLDEFGEYELTIVGASDEVSKTFSLVKSELGYGIYDFFIEKKLKEPEIEKKNYSVYVGGAILFSGFGYFIYIKRKS